MTTELTNEYGDSSSNQKSVACMNKQTGSALKKEKLKKHQTLQQIITARQEKIYEQQCEIDALRKKIRLVCNDNKFLREQNYWQTKALEKLDGKHAELPQIINGHLEEIKVFREQIKRMKEVLKTEKQRRHEAEAANERAFVELKHLRKLAEEQNLLEKEELMRTVQKLQQETEERERLLLNLERYAENLEKNQRFESIRHAKTQKDMRETCQSLLNRILALEQTVQEKQKIIELGNIYSKRISRPHKRADSVCLVRSTDTGTLCSDHMPHRLDHQSSDLDSHGPEKTTNRKERIRKKRTTSDCGDRGTRDDHGGEYDADAPHYKPFHGSTTNKRDHLERVFEKMNDDVIVLPKIEDASMDGPKSPGNKRAKCTHDSKQVRFSSNVPDVEKIFEELRNSEHEARIVAEKHLFGTQFSDTDSQLIGDSDLLTGKNVEAVRKLLFAREPKDKTSHRPSGTTSNQLMQMAKSPISDHCCMPSPFTDEGDMGPLYTGSRASSAPALLNTPQVSRSPSDTSVHGTANLVPMSETIQQICRPCGDQEIDDFFIADTCGDSSSDTMATANEEDYMWAGTPPNNAGSSARSSRIANQNYDEPISRPAVFREDVPEVETEGAAVFDSTKKVRCGGDTPRTVLPVISCAIRTKTLYCMNTNRTEETNKKPK